MVDEDAVQLEVCDSPLAIDDLPRLVMEAVAVQVAARIAVPRRENVPVRRCGQWLAIVNAT